MTFFAKKHLDLVEHPDARNFYELLQKEGIEGVDLTINPHNVGNDIFIVDDTPTKVSSEFSDRTVGVLNLQSMRDRWVRAKTSTEEEFSLLDDKAKLIKELFDAEDQQYFQLMRLVAEGKKTALPNNYRAWSELISPPEKIQMVKAFLFRFRPSSPLFDREKSRRQMQKKGRETRKKARPISERGPNSCLGSIKKLLKRLIVRF